MDFFHCDLSNFVRLLDLIVYSCNVLQNMAQINMQYIEMIASSKVMEHNSQALQKDCFTFQH